MNATQKRTTRPSYVDSSPSMKRKALTMTQHCKRRKPDKQDTRLKVEEQRRRQPQHHAHVVTTAASKATGKDSATGAVINEQQRPAAANAAANPLHRQDVNPSMAVVCGCCGESGYSLELDVQCSRCKQVCCRDFHTSDDQLPTHMHARHL